MAAVIDHMVEVGPVLAPLLSDEIVGGLPCLQIAEIAKELVSFVKSGDTACLVPILQIAEDVLRIFGQQGRDFIGACFAEGVPLGDEPLLKPFAGPLVRRELESQEW
jgi:hypothetical protein